ncbi:MAG: tRNA (guanosine(37)-N1)-methyltransferase TrmD [Caldisericia bacterium]|nr:tRNA (guanosine(37)-N1)-methyltransferase TrmD [Caldisericia bacterium]MDD4613898.1 tRNA (guanosine(37)-N1)-methyltransferase TrmD [Caldisericia bacterium]
MNTRLHYLTTFPGILDAYFNYSLPGKAVSKGLISYQTVNLRDYTQDAHRTTDDTPFGGGPGMVMKLDPIVQALQDCRQPNSLVILPTPKGTLLTQEVVHHISSYEHLIFICGHYEGVDDRVFQYVDMPLSIGDYVLGGGEISSIVITDAVIRFVKGVLGNQESTQIESFEDKQRLEHPNFTRPATYNEMGIPDVLLSGHHQKIEEWRKLESLRWTLLLKPELIQPDSLSKNDLQRLRTIKASLNRTIDSLLNNYE